MEMAEGISAVGCAKAATGRLMVWRSIEDRGAGADAYILFFFPSSRFPSLAMQVGRFWVIQCEAHLTQCKESEYWADAKKKKTQQ